MPRSQPVPSERPGGRPGVRRSWLAAVTLVVAVGAGVGVLALRRHPGGDDRERPTAGDDDEGDPGRPVRHSLGRCGTLGFGPERLVKGAGEGVVTRLPKVGDTVARGKPLYWVNDRPVPVLLRRHPALSHAGQARPGGQRRGSCSDNLEGPRLPHRPQPSRAQGRHQYRRRPGAAHRAARRRPEEVAACDTGLEPTGTIGSGRSLCCRAGPGQHREGSPR